MSIKLGVSLYSYQQAQFFKQLLLEDQIKEVGENLHNATGIELIDEMSLPYPNPSKKFVDGWFSMMDQYGVEPVAMDVGMDVLQFRDHVMTHEECAERLRHDIKLASRLGFSVVRVLSTTPLDVMAGALDVAENLNIKLGKEVHQPMRLEGQQVTEIIEFAESTGTTCLGIVPDFGIFQTRPSEALLGWYERKGAAPAATLGVVNFSDRIRKGDMPSGFDQIFMQTAGNIRSDFRRFLTEGECLLSQKVAFDQVRETTNEYVTAPQEIDFIVMSEALLFSHTSPDVLRHLCAHVVCVHGKFYEMSPVPDKKDTYQDQSIEYESAIQALKDGGFDGYICSEYEGQRYYQDREHEHLMSEVDQVRRHQEMLSRLVL